MKICSRDYKLMFSRKRDGGAFNTGGLGGRGTIEVGTESNHLPTMAVIVAHEAIETILTRDGKRYCGYSHGNNNKPMPHEIFFEFDHVYLDGFDAKLVDALVSSGFFKLCDPRKKNSKTGKRKCER